MSDRLRPMLTYLTPKNRTLSEEDTNRIHSVFYQCDLGHKGYLAKKDLKIAVVALLGYKPSKIEIERMLTDNYVNNQSGELVKGLTLNKFTGAMSVKMATVDEDEYIRQTFLAFDTQCRGFLTVEDLKKVFAVVAPHLAVHRIESAFREIDRDGDGRVSYRDFDFMMKYDVDMHF